MKTLIIYDSVGKIFTQVTGDYTTPSGGMQYLEVDIDPTREIIKSVDTSVEPHIPNIVPIDAMNMTIDEYKQKLISKLEYNFANYLAKNPITSSCHKNTAALYTITKDKQNLLNAEISMVERSQKLNIDYSPSWNQHQSECTHDWTLEELYQLSFDMAAAIKPLLYDQQSIDAEIRKATTFEELLSIDVSFE